MCYPSYHLYTSPTDTTTNHDSDEALSNSGRFSDRPEYLNGSGQLSKGTFAPGLESAHVPQTQPSLRPTVPPTLHAHTRNDVVGRLHTYNYGLPPCLYVPLLTL